MRRTGNVLNFPSGQEGADKAFAVLFHLFVAFMLTFAGGFSENGLMILIVLGLLYNFFVRQRIHKTGYFQKNKVLLLILLGVFILLFKFIAALMLLLAGLYWLLVARSGKEAPYFLRFHILTSLILSFFLLMPYLLLSGFVQLLYSIFAIAHVSLFTMPLAMLNTQVLPLAFFGLIWAAAIWMSISALMGRTPQLPVVTPNVRHWS